MAEEIKKYTATATYTKEIQVDFEDDGELDILCQAHDALMFEHCDCAWSGEISDIEVVEVEDGD